MGSMQQLEREQTKATMERQIVVLKPKPEWTAVDFAKRFGYLTNVIIPKNVQGRGFNPVRLETHIQNTWYQCEYQGTWKARDIEQFQTLVALSMANTADSLTRAALAPSPHNIVKYATALERYRA